MVSLKPSRRRIVGLASLACSAAFVVLSFASVPAGAQSVSTATTPSSCPVLSLGNPNPGDNLIPGGMFISGTAFVPGATQDSGVSRVDLFLGERDNGGTFLGSAMPGTGTSGDPRAFNVEVTIPTSVNRGLNFAAYAFSVTGGLQTTVTFPVLVGVPPAKNPAATPTPIPMVETVTSQCPGAQTSAAASSASAPAVSATAAPALAIPASRSVTSTAGSACPVLSLANPNPADDLIPGGMFISGTAFDPSAAQGSGVSRVDLFLGQRDSGGMFLGSAVPGSAASGDPRAFSVEVTVPSSFNRGVDFAAYAISASGQQTTITFPIFVGEPPAKNPAATPTPIPMTETITSSCSTKM